jgi:hypothetical protein
MATKRIQTSIITYKISLDTLYNFIDKIKDLTKLDNSIVMNFSQHEILLFSVVGKNLDNVHAFKSHILSLKDFITKDKLEQDIRYILSDGKRFMTSMLMFHKYMKTQNIEDTVELKLYYNEEFCEKILIKNSKSKEETPGGKPNNHTHRLEIDDIDDVMNTETADFSFKLTKIDFDYLKTKTNIEKDNDILYLNIADNKLSIGENRWDHNICDIEHEDLTISFPKKYFKCINYDKDDSMTIYVTDTHLLIVGESTNLLITIEMTV